MLVAFVTSGGGDDDKVEGERDGGRDCVCVFVWGYVSLFSQRLIVENVDISLVFFVIVELLLLFTSIILWKCSLIPHNSFIPGYLCSQCRIQLSF